MIQNHSPINPVPIRSITTHVKAPKRLRKTETHKWSKPRKGKITCKKCGLTIDTIDRPFHIRCDYKAKNPFIVSTKDWARFWETINPPKKKKQTKRKEPTPAVYSYNIKQVICSQENLKLLDLVGRLGIPKTAKRLGIKPTNIHNKIFRIRNRLEQGQIEINKLRGLMVKYPYIKKLLTPKTLKPTEADLIRKK